MSDNAPSRDSLPHETPQPRLPDPLPDGTNPFRVIDWLLFTARCAAVLLTDARLARADQLGRKMRTEDRGRVLMLHWEDDVDRRAVENELSRLVNPWWKAHSDARKLCAGHGIPFNVYDPILKAAWDKLEEFWSVVQGVASDKEVHLDGDLGRRLHELADSTTPTRPQTTDECKTIHPAPHDELRPDVVEEPIIWYHGERSYSRDKNRPFVVTPEMHNILTVFLDRTLAKEGRDLETESGVTNIARAVKDLCDSFGGVFGPAVCSPGGKGKGGYFIRVRTAPK